MILKYHLFGYTSIIYVIKLARYKRNSTFHSVSKYIMCMGYPYTGVILGSKLHKISFDLYKFLSCTQVLICEVFMKGV